MGTLGEKHICISHPDWLARNAQLFILAHADYLGSTLVS
jgi:hypothetical protein